MTTEDDFQAALDANPDDSHTRLVFADWLQDRDDPRAEGYRALGAIGAAPKRAADLPSRWERAGRWYWYVSAGGRGGDMCLPSDWFARVADADPDQRAKPPLPRAWRKSRRAAEDAAALAFAKLPAERRAELLGAAAQTA